MHITIDFVWSFVCLFELSHFLSSRAVISRQMCPADYYRNITKKDRPLGFRMFFWCWKLSFFLHHRYLFLISVFHHHSCLHRLLHRHPYCYWYFDLFHHRHYCHWIILYHEYIRGFSAHSSSWIYSLVFFCVSLLIFHLSYPMKFLLFDSDEYYCYVNTD